MSPNEMSFLDALYAKEAAGILEDIVMTFIEYGVDIRSQRGLFVKTVLYMAVDVVAEIDIRGVMKLLLDGGIEIDARGVRRMTVLHLVVDAGNTRVVKFVLERDADTSMGARIEDERREVRLSFCITAGKARKK